jgi:5'-methylthioadenosine phosphorylase
MVIKNLLSNVQNAKRILAEAIEIVPVERSCYCKDALKHAIITDKKLIPAKVKKDLGIIIGKYIK